MSWPSRGLISYRGKHPNTPPGGHVGRNFLCNVDDWLPTARLFLCVPTVPASGVICTDSCIVMS